MLIPEDKKELVDGFSQIFATKQDLADLEQRVNEQIQSSASSILSAVDAYAKRADTFFQEFVVMAHRIDRHEKWIHQIADKLGVKLEY